MKKIMIAVAIVCVAAFAQASAFSWNVSAMGKVYQSGTTTLLSGTAYLFDANTYAQATLLDAMLTSTGIDFTQSVASSAMTSGILSGNTPTAAKKQFTYGNDGDVNSFYMVIVDDKNTFVSATVNGSGVQGKETTVQTSGGNPSKAVAAEWNTGDSFGGAGWYTAAAVPEPTSGLLLLLGVAGLALKRKRA